MTTTNDEKGFMSWWNTTPKSYTALPTSSAPSSRSPSFSSLVWDRDTDEMTAGALGWHLVRRLRWVLLGIALVLGGFLVVHFDHGLLFDEAYPDDRWSGRIGRTESQGWSMDSDKGLKELGSVAEDRYKLGSRHEFMSRLHDFVDRMPAALQPGMLAGLAEEVDSPMTAYRNIFQTDKSVEDAEMSGDYWQEMNPGWERRFFDDAGADDWVKGVFGDSIVDWAWDYMSKGVLKADFLRYLLPLVEGGVYSDSDTRPLRPIDTWGKRYVEYVDLSETDGPDWQDDLADEPAVIIGMEVDVHSIHWEDNWPRPVGICQWTLSSAPNHPIFIEAARRVVENTVTMAEADRQRVALVEDLKMQGDLKGAKALRTEKLSDMEIMEWTGPGMFSDSVFAYLGWRYNMTWHRLRGLDHPLRIGDVMILPITGFSPEARPDFHSGSRRHPLANVLHDFRGSWKGSR